MKVKRTELEARLQSFADKHLRRDIPSRVKKFGEESGEFNEAMLHMNVDAAIEEAADMAIVLTDIVDLLSGGTTSLSEAMEKKFAVVLARKYAHGERIRDESVQ